MSRFLTGFLLLASGLFVLVYLPPVREGVIGPFTMAITELSGGLIQVFGGRAWVTANTLSIPGFAVQVLDMCNGVEATLILWAALLAFPAPWGYRLKGLVLGTLTVHGLNILRIVSLVYLGAWNREVFHWVHWYVWDGLIMLDILLVFLAWMRWMPAPEGPDGAAPA